MPKVSVIIPTYNRRVYLQQAIESVLAQSYTDFELLVIDDGSSDGTDEMVRLVFGDKVRYIWQQNQGESHARNHGISEAQGIYIAFLDSDDIWLPEKLFSQVPVLDADPMLGLVYCQSFHMNSEGAILPGKPYSADILPSQITLEEMLVRNVMSGVCTTGLFRRDVLVSVGGFDPLVQYGEDRDLGIRILAITRAAIIPEPLACNRDHPGKQSLVLDKSRVARRFADIMYCTDHYAKLFTQPEIQVLIQRMKNRQYIVSALLYLATDGYLDAEGLLQQAKAERVEELNDQSLWKEQIVACAWMVFMDHKALSTVENFAISALRLMRKYCDQCGNDREILVDLYLSAEKWFFQSGMPRVALEALWKLVKIRPLFLVSLEGLKTCLQLLIGKRAVKFLASLPQAAKRRRN